MKFILTLAAVCAAVAAQAEYREGYYDMMDGMHREDLKAAAKECVAQHTALNYSDLPNYWALSDTYEERYDGDLRFWDMYSNEIYLIHSDETGKQAFSRNKMQREHAVPKSWWKKGDDVEYTPAYSDMWNLYPSDGSANQAKSNYPPGMVEKASFDNSVSKVGSPASGYGGGSKSVFEPADEYKGDFARAFFYMATVYDDLPWKYTYMFRTESWPTIQPWAMEMLLDWARKDPVSRKETDRNDAVEQCQGNRNPYIDFPELAEYVWGSRTGETFRISDQGGVGEIWSDQGRVCEYSGGAVRILRDTADALSVFDTTGRRILHVQSPKAGDTYTPAASGTYIVRIGKSALKIAN